MRNPFAARIVAALDPLRAKLRRAELKQVARALAAAGVPRDAGDLALAVALVDQADAAAHERAALAASVEKLGDALATHGRAVTRALLDDHLALRGASRGERAALDGALDADGVAERDARELARLDGTRELCVAAAGRLAADALLGGRLDGLSSAAPSPLAPEARLPARLIAHGADRAAAWTVRVAALDAARAIVAAQPWPAPATLIEQLDVLADDAGDDRWVQIAAVRTLGAAEPSRARTRARARLLHPRPAPDDFIVRARLARILTTDLADPAAAVALAVAAHDGSEHVRQSVARGCAGSGDPACRVLLARLADFATEPSPRVRAVAALAHASRAAGAAGPTESLPAARALARAVLTDPHPLPQTLAADTAAECAAVDNVDPDVRDILCTALEQARRTTDAAAPTVNALARAAERAVLRVGPQAELRAVLRDAIAGLDENDAVRVAVDAAIPDDTVGRVLAELAQRDFGLYADRKNGQLTLRRGERMKLRAWRVLHELKRPMPSKRQGHEHTIGRVFDARLRAHPAGLAEVAPTRVPGERVHVEREGGWGSYLPLVDDFLSLSGKEARLYSEHGVTIISAPEGVGARAAAEAQLTTRYAELADLRLRSLASSDPVGRGAYATALAKLGYRIRFEAYDGAPAPDHLRALLSPRRLRLPAAGDSLQPVSLALLPAMPAVMNDALRTLSDTNGGGVAELALFAGAAGMILAGRSLATRVDIQACRRAIPLVIGGWGTRGKSGVERLKAGLFHALGYEVVSKTTGCEATVLVGVPGRPLTEVPLYRPYEKATIWEQRDVLRFAGARRPHVLLWECMALNPGYVDLLQRGWMRDDLSTITNAYPDHEDIQGPSGLDVARVIAGFTPANATLVTAEDQMLPVIRERARAEKSKLVSVGPSDHELIPGDLLARFPYQEHPRNVALVMALAEELGVDPEVALVEMADHVLADVGGLSVYGPVPIAGRRVRFANGMSANERASAMGNWRRLGFDAHDPDDEPDRWIVALVNNRADRAARTTVFGEAVVEELAAHRVMLVGTNTAALRRAIEEALGARLSKLTAAMVPELLAQMKIGAASVDAALRELEAWLGRRVDDATLRELLANALAHRAGEGLSGAARGVEASGALRRLEDLLDPELARQLRPFARSSWIRRRVGAALRAAPLDAHTGARLRDLFMERVFEPADPVGPADDLAGALAASCPPGVLVDVMGLQNIKGPGLALVHFFAAGERALADAAALASPAPEAREAAARRLRELDGVGARVLTAAAARLEELAPTLNPDERARAEGLAGKLRGRAAMAGAVPERRSLGPLAQLRAGVRSSLDHLSSSSRRRRADRLFGDLAHGRIATTRAARELGAVCEEQRA